MIRRASLPILTVWLLTALLPAAPPAGAAAGRDFVVAPAPSWVDEAEVPDSADAAPEARDGVLDLLEDGQVRVAQGGVESYYRRVSKVLTPAGLEHASQLQLDFDPSSERLVVHYVRIRRGNVTLDALRPEDVRVVQPERELDEQIYTGDYAAVVFLRDVRPGDVVDYAFSVNASGTLGGRYADSLPLGEPYPVRRVRWRLLWPEGRPIHTRARNTAVIPEVRPLGQFSELVWEVREAPAVEDDETAPAWFDPTPRVDVSEFASWADVARSELPYYATPGEPGPELARLIETWTAAGPAAEDRLLAAARFVQDEIRYTGIELGASSYRPAMPSDVLTRRFGDCKDKTLLLVTALRRMGIEADPALVSADGGRLLADAQPSPLAFDHVIARVRLEGRTFWIDPTISLQRGGLAGHTNPDFGYALVIREGVEGLEEIAAPQDEPPTLSVVQTFTVGAWDGPAVLDVVTTYSGGEADDARFELAQMSLAELGRTSVAFYSDDYPGLEADGAPTVTDDPVANTVVIAERFTIPRFWEDGSRVLVADRIEEVLPKRRDARSAAPVALHYPANVAQTIRVKLPGPADLEGDDVALDSDALRFSYRRALAGDVLTLEFRLRILRDSVAPDRAVELRETVRAVRKLARFTLPGSPASPQRFPALAALIAVCAVAAGVAGWRRRRRKKTPAAAAGAERACACGGDYSSGQPVWQHDVVDGGRDVTIAGVPCSVCGTVRAVIRSREAPRRAGAGA